MEGKNSTFKEYIAPVVVLVAICLVITLALALTNNVTAPVIEANDKAAAEAALLSATSVIDKAAKKGVYHKNNAARKVSRLAKAVNAMA